MEYELKRINKAFVRVPKLPEHSRERIELAKKRLRELAPYVEKVLEESKEE